jgi:carbonyl reductase 1
VLISIVRQLALQYPKSSISNGGKNPLLIYLTARDKGRGEDAIKKLDSDPLLVEARALKAAGGLTEIKYHQLDIADDQSIKEFAGFLAKEHPDGVDISE